jgi:hypothetical protein
MSPTVRLQAGLMCRADVLDYRRCDRDGRGCRSRDDPVLAAWKTARNAGATQDSFARGASRVEARASDAPKRAIRCAHQARTDPSLQLLRHIASGYARGTLADDLRQRHVTHGRRRSSARCDHNVGCASGADPRREGQATATGSRRVLSASTASPRPRRPPRSPKTHIAEPTSLVRPDCNSVAVRVGAWRAVRGLISASPVAAASDRGTKGSRCADERPASADRTSTRGRPRSSPRRPARSHPAG